MGKILFLVIVVALIVIAVLVFHFGGGDAADAVGKVGLVVRGGGESDSSGDAGEESFGVEGGEDSFAGDGGEGGLGGDGGSAGSSSGAGAGSSGEEICLEETISYALKNFEQTSTCNSYQGEVCTDKTVDCFIDVQNLGGVAGLFEIGFDFVAAGDVIGFDSDSYTLNPMARETFHGSLQVQGENAGEDVTCSFNLLQVPTVETCV